MRKTVKMKQILQSAFFLMASTNIVFYLLSLGYILVSPKVIYVHLAVMLYNVGVNSFVIFLLVSYLKFKMECHLLLLQILNLIELGKRRNVEAHEA